MKTKQLRYGLISSLMVLVMLQFSIGTTLGVEGLPSRCQTALEDSLLIHTGSLRRPTVFTYENVTSRQTNETTIYNLKGSVSTDINLRYTNNEGIYGIVSSSVMNYDVAHQMDWKDGFDLEFSYILRVANGSVQSIPSKRMPITFVIRNVNSSSMRTTMTLLTYDMAWIGRPNFTQGLPYLDYHLRITLTFSAIVTDLTTETESPASIYGYSSGWMMGVIIITIGCIIFGIYHKHRKRFL